MANRLATAKIRNTPTNARHAIVIPNYKEDMATLEGTLENMAQHAIARTAYDVFLAMEQAEKGHELKAKELIDKYSLRFNFITFCAHPSGIHGELAGKGSNLCWATKEISNHYSQHGNADEVVLTIMDADTWHAEEYFLDLKATDGETMFIAPVIFDRNRNQVPSFVRNADSMWACGAISGMHPGSPIMPPMSTYSLPLRLAEEAGFWDPGPEAIGEDLHMYLKCFFETQGRLKVQPVWAPANHCNVHAESNSIFSFYIEFFKVRYKQALRHMWGSLDTGYCVRHILSTGTRVLKTPGSTRPSTPVQEYDLEQQAMFPSQSMTTTTSSLQFWPMALLLATRMFEAHILPTHLSILIIWTHFAAPQIQSFATHNPNLLTMLKFLELSRQASYIITIGSLLLQDRLLTIVAASHGHKRKTSWLNCIEYLFFPLSGFLFGTLPALQAQICHFWTDRLTYSVSIKPLESFKRTQQSLPI